MVMDRTSVTRALTPLERDGFVKTRAGGDKRTRIVSLTNKGVRLLTNARPLWDEAQNTFLHLVGNQHWSALRELLKDTTRLVHHRDEATNTNIDIKRNG